jgi:hypothetical protein
MTPLRAVRAAILGFALVWLAMAATLDRSHTGYRAEPISIAFASAVDGQMTRPVPTHSSALEATALDEMLRGSKGQMQRWATVPELVVLGSVMEYRTGDRADYLATADVLDDEEVAAMVDDLTQALAVLSGNTFRNFSAVKRERVAAGSASRITRPNQIVVGRYRGVQAELKTIGLGGRSTRADGIITAAAILLDDDFDRTNPARRLLRMHELGHALGYNHVQARTSIMNPRIGPEPTDFDRRAALIAFAR